MVGSTKIEGENSLYNHFSIQPIIFNHCHAPFLTHRDVLKNTDGLSVDVSGMGRFDFTLFDLGIVRELLQIRTNPYRAYH